MIVTPARPPARQLVDIDDCGAVLESLMGSNGRERNELLQADVPLHRINALYPLDLEDFIAAVMRELVEHGVGHLRADVVTREQWYINYDLVRRINNQLPLAERQAFGDAWYHVDEDSLIHEFGIRIQTALKGWHPEFELDNLAAYYSRILLTLHWFASHPSQAGVALAERRTLQEWVVNALLPAETSASR